MRTIVLFLCFLPVLSASAQGLAVRSKDGLSTNLTISGSVTGAPLAVSARPVATYSANRKALLQVTDGTNILAAFGVTSENATNKYGQLELFGGAHAEYDNVTGLHITDTNLWGSPFDPRAALIRVKSVSGNRTNLGYVFLLQTQMGTNTARRTNQTTTYSDSFAIDQGGAVLLGNLGLLADQAPGVTNYGHGEVVIIGDAHSTRPALVFTNESQEWGRLFTAHYILINGSNRTSVVTANGDFGMGTNNPVATAEIFSTDADGALKITGQFGTTLLASTNGGLTISSNLLVGNGSDAAPAIGFSADNDGSGTGIRRSAANQLAIINNGAPAHYFDATAGYNVPGLLRFGASFDLNLYRDAAENLQLGADGTTTTGTISGADGTGANVAGAAVALQGGASTGTARGGAVILQTSTNGAAASAVNGVQNRAYVNAKEVALTESTATLVFSNSLASGKWVSIKVFASTHADDGTDFQVVSEVFTIAAVNKAGTVTTTVSASAPSATQQSSGTLTTTWTAVANGNGIDVKNSAVSSLTQTTLATQWRVEIDGNDSNVITPQ